MEILDGANDGQEWWLPVVREGVREKNELEVKLRQMKVEETERLEEEWWVTKTVGTQEVRSELQKWVGPAKKEYVAMTEELKAVRPVQRKMVDELQGVVEFLPSKAVCTRKAPDGRRKVRGVVCGNYASSSTQRGHLRIRGRCDTDQEPSQDVGPERMVHGGDRHKDGVPSCASA